MRAVLQNIKTGNVSVEDLPQPILKPGNVLVRNHYSLVSAGTEKSVLEFSNANYFKKARLRPDLFRKVIHRAMNEGIFNTYRVVSELIEQKIQLGYSSAGVVIDVGDDVTDIQIGQRVACAGLFVATHSEVISVPRNLLSVIPDEVDNQHAAFVTIGAIAMQGIRLAEISLSENIVIYGLGLVGMVVAQLAVAAGCRVIGVDIDEQKVRMAQSLGIKAFSIDSHLESKILNFTDGFGSDKVILCAATKSKEPVKRIPAFTRQKGILVVVGDVRLDIPRREYYEKEIDIRISRSYGPGRYDVSYEELGVDYPYGYVRWTENRNMQSTLDLLARGKINFSKLITHCFDIEDAPKAYELIEGAVVEPYLGILIRYSKKVDAVKKPSSSISLVSGEAKKQGGVNFGIIGAGNFGKAFLLPVFNKQPNVRFIGICTASGVSAAAMARKYDMEFATSDPEEIFSHSDINALVIATRHDSHAEYILRGLQADKAVYVEKPLATTFNGLEEIKEKIEQKQKNRRHPYLMVGFNRRFSPLTRTIKKVFQKTSEPLAIIYRVNAGFIPKSEWILDPIQGAGRIIGECCHFIDCISFIIGKTPMALSATALMKNKDPVMDVVTITLEYPNGSMGTIHYFSNGNPKLPKEFIEVFGGNACAQLINFRKIKLFGVKAAGKTNYLNQAKGFEEEAKIFVSYLKRGEQMPIPFQEIYVTTKATLLVKKAIVSGRKILLN